MAAFLIGKDRGTQTGEYIYMTAAPEWKPIYKESVRELPLDQRISFEDLVSRLDGDLCGRRVAGSVYPDELEEIFRGKFKETGRYDFRRGVKDPSVYLCLKTGLAVVHHIDDGRCAGKTSLLDKLPDEDLLQHCEIISGPLEAEGVRVKILGRTQARLPGAILTAPDPKRATKIIAALEVGPKKKSQVPSKKASLENLELLSVRTSAQCRSAGGSAIYLSPDRRDIPFAVKELAHHMAAPRACD